MFSTSSFILYSFFKRLTELVIALGDIIAKLVTAVLAKNSLSMPSIKLLSSFKAKISKLLWATWVKVSSANSIDIPFPATLPNPLRVLPIVFLAKFKGTLYISFLNWFIPIFLAILLAPDINFKEPSVSAIVAVIPYPYEVKAFCTKE